MRFYPPALSLTLAMSLLIASAKAEQPPLSKDELSRKLGYPAERLNVEDLTQKVREKNGASIVSAHRYSGAENTFAPITVVVAQEGTLLTEQLQRQTDEAIAKATAEGRKTPMSRIKVAGGGHGIATLGGVGPGGSQERWIITLPAQKRDVQMTLTIPSEEPLEQVPQAEGYYKALTEEGLAERLLLSLNVVASKNLTAVAPPAPPDATPIASIPTPAPPVPNTPPVASSSPTTPVVETPAVPVERKSPVWPWVVGILALIVIVTVALKRRA
jgi:hypothetical protein